MREALKVRNNLTKTMAIVLFVLSITLVTAGCSPKPVEAIESSTTANTPVSPEAKPAPSPPIETKSPRALELEALLEKAPEIDGLTKFIDDDKIVYKNAEGVKSGYYVVKAYYNGEETDGVSLSAEVIEGIVSKNREEGLDGSLAMPVDPSEEQVVKVEFLSETLIGRTIFKTGVITITPDSKISIVNSIFGNGLTIRNITSTSIGPAKSESYFQLDTKSKVISGNYLLTSSDSFISDTDIPRQTPFNIVSGESLGKTKSTLILRKIYQSVEDLDKYFIYESDILKISSSLVFCMVNESR